MANSPATNVFSLLDSANNQLVRADSGTSTITWAKSEKLDITATTGGVSFTPSTFGFASGCQAYVYNSGTVNVTVAQSPQSISVGPSCMALLPTLGTGAISFTSASSTASVYVILLGS